jgi:phosphate transport system substrate-binding protein
MNVIRDLTWSGSRVLVIPLGLLFVTAIGGCGDSERELTLTGSSTVAPLASQIAKQYERDHPNVRIEVQAGGSSRGITDARRGTADIGMASRALTGKDGELRAHTIARDGIALIVHEDNPTDKLSRQQVIDLYTGEVDNWHAVGGADAPATIVNKSAGRATLEVFLNYFEMTNEQVEPDMVIGHNQEAIKAVAGNPDAIGYVSIGVAEYEQANGTPIKLLPIQGVAASSENVADGSYPKTRPLNFVTDDKPTGLTKRFIAYAQSQQVHDLIRGEGYVPIQR